MYNKSNHYGKIIKRMEFRSIYLASNYFYFNIFNIVFSVSNNKKIHY